MKVHVEIGKKRTFAGAIDWPGWCRSGVDEDSALQALLEYAPRYARAVETAQLEFSPPGDISVFKGVERLRGNAGTEFVAPNVSPANSTGSCRRRSTASSSSRASSSSSATAS